MTRNQFQQFAEHSSAYAYKTVKFFRFIPSLNDYVECIGIIGGIGVGCNSDCVIIASCGIRHAIHFSKVQNPMR